MKRPQKRFNQTLNTSSLGLEMGGAVALGYFVGTWADKAFDLAPWGSVFFMIVGFGTAIKAFVRVAARYRREITRQDGGS